jgi:hypothetical protein
VNPIHQDNLWHLFGDVESGEDIVDAGVVIDAHLAGKPVTSFGKIISQRRK